jgi:hypothetical protein
MTESEYKKSLRPHTRALRQLVTNLDFFLEDIGPINVFSISSRLKEYGSAGNQGDLGYLSKTFMILQGFELWLPQATRRTF